MPVDDPVGGTAEGVCGPVKRDREAQGEKTAQQPNGPRDNNAEEESGYGGTSGIMNVGISLRFASPIANSTILAAATQFDERSEHALAMRRDAAERGQARPGEGARILPPASQRR
ncbi:hypothetical protein [Ensifer soli]|uniref:hypothetical protein n=1 Tax=Ciceribacter sp. sgz301302 TaxID=3342379 RepID=UPI0035BB9092